jgi:hypothetical protein
MDDDTKMRAEKQRRVTLKEEEAKRLKAVVEKVKRPRDLLNMPEIRSHLLTAAGVSTAARQFLEDKFPSDLTDALERLIAELPDEDFVEPLIIRWAFCSGFDLTEEIAEAARATTVGQVE